MSSKNRGFAAGLVSSLDAPPSALRAEASLPPPRLGVGALAGRSNRLAELASGSLVPKAHELVDPSRCRMWSEHNRDYALLSEERCADLLESLKAQGRQEVPAIVRRLHGEADYDFEVICGARRHWSVSWLRAHNYPEFRFLVEVRDLTDEEAFRVSDLENRARADLSDLERARDYLRALTRHYDGRQKAMAQRLNVTETWLSRYLDLARLPPELIAAFPDPHALGIKHVTQLKPLLKPEERRARVLEEAQDIAAASGGGEGAPLALQAVIRRLTAAADAPKNTGTAPKKSGKAEAEILSGQSGRAVARVEGARRGEVSLTLLPKKGATRAEAEFVLQALLDRHWPT